MALDQAAMHALGMVSDQRGPDAAKLLVFGARMKGPNNYSAYLFKAAKRELNMAS